MKKLYTFMICAAVATTGAMASSHFKPAREQAAKKNVAVNTAGKLMKPESQTDYMYVDGQWVEVGKTSFTYDSRGNIIRQDLNDEDGQARIVTEYNEDNNPVTVLTTVDYGDGWMNDKKRTYVYDPVVSSFCTERYGFDWDGENWIKNYFCEINTVTRNANGNIVDIVKELPLGELLFSAYKSSWKYDEASGKAVEYEYFTNKVFSKEPEWELNENTSYRNIKWQETDGQMTASTIRELTQGANRIKSCDVYYNGEIDGHIFVDYSETQPLDYTLKETFADESVVGYTEQFEVLDAYGSYRITKCEYFDDNITPTTTPYYTYVTDVTIDEHGNFVSEVKTEIHNGVSEIYDHSKVDYIYDANGNPTEYTVSFYDFDEKDFVPESRVVFGAYSDVTSGIGSIETATDGFKVYTIQGFAVEGIDTADDLRNLPAGLYIVNGKKMYIRN